jgi:Uncharacterized protein conserved in bacteria (DUF2188)
MPTRRNVKQNASGRWEVLKDGHLRAPVSAETQSAAVSRAREQVRREGGGEVRVLDRAGRIVNSKTVPARKVSPSKTPAGGRRAA